MYKTIYLKNEDIKLVLEGLKMLKLFENGNANAAGQVAEDYYHRDVEAYIEASSAEIEIAIDIDKIDELAETFEAKLAERAEKEKE